MCAILFNWQINVLEYDIDLILFLEFCVLSKASCQGIDSSGCESQLFNVPFLHLPSQPKSLANLLHHLDHLPHTVFVLGGFVVQKQSRKHLDWSETHLGERIHWIM